MSASKSRTQLRLGQEALLRLPDVDEVLDIGHAIYTADNLNLAATTDHAVAVRQSSEFLALKAKANTPEVPYLRAMFGIARGYARDLSRAREEWLKDLQGAEDERNRREKQIRDGGITKQGLNALWKFVGPLFLALSGILFAQVVGKAVPTAVVETTGTHLPSVLTSLAFLFVGRYLSVWMYNRQINQIVTSYDARVFLAHKAYEEKKVVAFEFWRTRGSEEWRQYTGKPYPKKASYLMVMKGDMVARQNLRDHVLLSRKSDIERARDAVKTSLGFLAVRRWIPRRKEVPSPVQTE